MPSLKGVANALGSLSRSALKHRRSSFQESPGLHEVDEESPAHLDEICETSDALPNLESIWIEEVPKTPSSASPSLKYNFQDPNGPPGQLYRGEFKDSKKHGSGAMSFPQNDPEFKFMYHGDFIEDKMHGSGTLEWHDGKQYKGQFASNKLHGEGVMSWPDGRKYIGHYSEGRKHGLGTVQYPDGCSYCGSFSKGKMHGEVVYTDKHGLAKLIHFNQGKAVQVNIIGSNAATSPLSGREDSVPSDATTETASIYSGTQSLTASGPVTNSANRTWIEL
eukprot:gnl/MRDRNA2_/MRDRNA2_84670_c0_seq3.p1 gnl/MRDRNA2_/MRDRNA2_84670_c0~~gnl/MRDRNA2_/MRDRNA2_84670_c0_seq3.p1  ORF type:complete len:277 (+),score=37.50 gnl/MRDRNA2_/MRDRNA2_84670_c0_seq3:81-911(+)